MDISPVTFPALLTFSITQRNPDDHYTLRTCLLHTEMPALPSLKLATWRLASREVVEVAQRLAQMKVLESLEMIDGNSRALHVIIPHLPPLVSFSFRSSSYGFDVLDTVWALLGRNQTRLKELVIEQTCEVLGYVERGTCTRKALINLASLLDNTSLERMAIALITSRNENFDGPVPTLPSLRSLTFQYLEMDHGTEIAFATFLATLCPNLCFLGIKRFIIRRDHRRQASSASLEEAFWEKRGRYSPTSWKCLPNAASALSNAAPTPSPSTF